MYASSLVAWHERTRSDRSCSYFCKQFTIARANRCNSEARTTNLDKIHFYPYVRVRDSGRREREKEPIRWETYSLCHSHRSSLRDNHRSLFLPFFFFLQSSRFLLALYCRVETIGYLKHINDRYKQKWTREIILLSRRRTIDIVFPLWAKTFGNVTASYSSTVASYNASL